MALRDRVRMTGDNEHDTLFTPLESFSPAPMWRAKVTMEKIMSGCYYYAICLGMTSYRYNMTSKTYSSTRYTRLWALMANGLTILLMPFIMLEGLHLMDGFEESWLIFAVNLVQILMRVAVIIYTVLYRYRRERATLDLGLKIIKLENKYLSRLPKDKDTVKYFNRILLLNLLLCAYLALSSLMVFTQQKQKWTWYGFVLMLIFCNIGNIIWGTVINYNSTLWFIASSFCYLNSHLETLLQQFEALTDYRGLNEGSNTLKKMTSLLCRDFERLMRAHWKLSHMANQLNKAYGLQMLAIRLGCFVTNVTIGYYCAVLLRPGMLGWPSFVLGGLTYFIMILDLYLNDLMCDMTVRGYNETIHTLKIFNCHHLWNNRLRNAVEYFALSLSSNKLRLVYCGLFEVDKARFFALMTTMVSYIIMLLQFHLVLGKEAN